MLTDRPDFRAWLARYDARTFEMQANDPPTLRLASARQECDCCGGPLGDTPSQAGEVCLVCLAERFGGDQVEERLAKVLIGGLAKAALASDELRDGLLREIVLDAIEQHEYETGLSSGHSMERSRREPIFAPLQAGPGAPAGG